MEKIKAQLIGENVYSNSESAYYFNKLKYFGDKKEDKINYSIFETIYLIELGILEVYQNSRKLSKEDLLKKFQKKDKRILKKYLVYKDLRKRGYLLKSGLKYGADFRIYGKNKSPSEEHSKWLLIIEESSNRIKWEEFTSKNRVANSTKKNLLIAIFDSEESLIYYEIKWIKP
jgi:tRNA-intron endonuclease